MTRGLFWVWAIVLTLILGLVVLWPSFNLALTGDDYLGLWRYEFYTNGWGGETLSKWTYFFTDYGPMDMLTALIHNYYDFQPRVYYLFSFGLRFMAALSFLWPVYTLTKSKWSSLGAATFFIVTTTGLETTNWSFNMPSYVAIVFANTLLGCFNLSRTKDSIWLWLASGILFVLTIISQPIRAMFLPIVMVGLEAYWLITNFTFRNLIWGLSRIGMYSLLLVTVLKYTSYGEAVSLRGNDVYASYFHQVTQLIDEKDFKTLVTPISQIGKIILPNDFMYQRLEVWGFARTFRRVVVPTFMAFAAGLIFFQTGKRKFLLATLSAAIWTGFIWKLFMSPESTPLQPFDLLSYLWGGYLLIAWILAWFSPKLGKQVRLGVVLAMLTLVSGFALFWIRTPGFLHEITGRYLIVSGAGVAWLMAMLLAIKTEGLQRVALMVVFGLMLSLHAKVSYRYLYHLAEVRGVELTTRLRQSVTRPINYGNPQIPQVFYFEGDNAEMIYHAFIFGWPVISHYQYGGPGSWYNTAPTSDWQEVVSAYQDGESLKRFMPGPYAPVALENIHAYRLKEGTLYNVSVEKRQLLRELKTNKLPK